MSLPNLGKGRKAERVVRAFMQSALRYLGFGFVLLSPWTASVIHHFICGGIILLNECQVRKGFLQQLSLFWSWLTDLRGPCSSERSNQLIVEALASTWLSVPPPHGQ